MLLKILLESLLLMPLIPWAPVSSPPLLLRLLVCLSLTFITPVSEDAVDVLLELVTFVVIVVAVVTPATPVVSLPPEVFFSSSCHTCSGHPVRPFPPPAATTPPPPPEPVILVDAFPMQLMLLLLLVKDG